MDATLKRAVHQLVEDCDNTESLQEVYTILEAGKKGKDWWQTLSTAQQERTLVSMEQSKAGKVISHEEVSKRIWKKLNQ